MLLHIKQILKRIKKFIFQNENVRLHISIFITGLVAFYYFIALNKNK